MTGLIRKATLLSVCGLLVAGVAMASVPNAAQSTCPNVIRLSHLVTGAVPYPGALFTVVVRDIGGNPVWGSKVEVDFNTVAPDMRFSCAQTGVTVVGKTVYALTDPTGTVSFTILGNALGAPFSAFNMGKCTADGILLKNVGVATYDYDAASGIASGDLSLFVTDFFTPNGAERTDLDGNGLVNSGDLSLWVTAYFYDNPGTSATGPYCSP